MFSRRNAVEVVSEYESLKESRVLLVMGLRPTESCCFRCRSRVAAGDPWQANANTSVNGAYHAYLATYLGTYLGR